MEYSLFSARGRILFIAFLSLACPGVIWASASAAAPVHSVAHPVARMIDGLRTFMTLPSAKSIADGNPRLTAVLRQDPTSDGLRALEPLAESLPENFDERVRSAASADDFASLSNTFTDALQQSIAVAVAAVDHRTKDIIASANSAEDLERQMNALSLYGMYGSLVERRVNNIQTKVRQALATKSFDEIRGALESMMLDGSVADFTAGAEVVAGGSSEDHHANALTHYQASARAPRRSPPPISKTSVTTADMPSRSQIISRLHRLSVIDPTTARSEAQSFLANVSGADMDVLLAALRALESTDPVQSSMLFVGLLENPKANWYLRRESARILGQAADALSPPVRSSAVKALQTASEDDNASLRLTTKNALAQFGVALGQEKAATQAITGGNSQSSERIRILEKFKPIIGWLILLAGGTWIGGLFWRIYSEYDWYSEFRNVGTIFLDYLFSSLGVVLGAAIIGAIAWASWFAFRSFQGSRNVLGPGLERPTTRFADVAGIPDSVTEVGEIIEFLRHPDRFKRLGARSPKGILLVGPPGTGKTLLARAIAGESKANFIAVSGSDFDEVWVGLGAARIRDMFNRAVARKPAIIFIDEIDAVGHKRDAGPNGGGGGRDQTLNALLTKMDGFDNSGGVVVIAATNREDILDPALKRPGRFDRTVFVGLPDVFGRENILQFHARRSRLAADVDLRMIAQRTSGLSGAFLENIVNEGSILAARRNSDAVEMRDLNEAVDRQAVGQQRSLLLSETEKMEVAYHESGHALVAHALGSKLHKITVVPHGQSLGHASTVDDEDAALSSKKSVLQNRIAILFGGLAAEELLNEEFSNDVSNDLSRASEIARMMVEQFGMGRRSGWMVGERPQMSERARRDVERDIKDLLDQAHKTAQTILIGRREALDRLAQELAAKETLEREDILHVVDAPAPK